MIITSATCLVFGMALTLPPQSGWQGKQAQAPPQDIVSGLVRLPDRSDFLEPIRGNWMEFGGVGEDKVASVICPSSRVAIHPLDTPGARLHWELRTDRGAWTPFMHLVERGLVTIESTTTSDPWSSLVPERWVVLVKPGSVLQLRDVRTNTGGFSGARVLVDDGQMVWLEHGLSHFELVEGRPVALLARFGGEEGEVLRSAHVNVAGIDGTQSLEMHDDGLHGDHLAGDGLFGAWMPRGMIGRVRATTFAFGTTGDKRPIQRTGVQYFDIAPETISWAGHPGWSGAGEGKIRLQLPAFVLPGTDKVHLAAELWGTDSSGQWQPVRWMARQVPCVGGGQAEYLTLDVDLSWLTDAGLGEPLALRHVRVQNPNGWMVLASVPEWSLPPLASGLVHSAPHSFGLSAAINGGNMALDSGLQRKTALLLTHGWCSGGATFPLGHFTGNVHALFDPDQNHSHDEFAQVLLQFGSPHPSFGLVAHSQGGMAALHLRTYYQSGLDNAQGPRRIQALASPFQGTPLAALGGLLCGVNDDMTLPGSAAWLANIPTGPRSEVHYYTTEEGGLFACSLATALFLTNPEDGTVEMIRGQLPGGQNMGHVDDWCHTGGMADPAGYTDGSRNTIMNAQAAR